ncbi:MAG: alpha-L-arabinofuranosidase C-terminal domain-containing protein [Bryobacteraceae bacterium]
MKRSHSGSTFARGARKRLSRRALLSAAAGLAAAPALRSQSPGSRIELLLDEPIGRIAPEIYGHFVEHLGGVVYDGIWVGEGSSIPNTGGLRKQLVDALAAVKPGVIRWPGGCFADQYDWHDGVGPRAQRPRRTNFWVDSREWPAQANRKGVQIYDSNHFGTVEFARLCQATGAEPYIAANLRSLPAQDFWRWVEYCNSPESSTTLADRRAADGSRAPLNVQYWGVGNESWGCGGNFEPDEYAVEFRRYTAWVPAYSAGSSGRGPRMVGSGPNGGEIAWTRRFFEAAAKRGGLNRMWGWGLHHYSWNASAGRTRDWFEGKRDALRFDNEQYYEILAECLRIDPLIRNHWDVMGEVDREHRIKLVVDEWGSWYAPGTEPFPEALIGQQNTMRDAVLAGLTLDTFHRHAEKVGMANIAQLVNCLQSLFLAHEDKFCVTPTYHVFGMYAPHQGAQSLRVVDSAPRASYTRNGKPASIPGLSASASLAGKRLTLTVTNPSLDQTRETSIVLRGATVRSAEGTVLAAADAHAHNSFAQPNAVEPKSVAVKASGSEWTHRFPPASVTRVSLELA